MPNTYTYTERMRKDVKHSHIHTTTNVKCQTLTHTQNKQKHKSGNEETNPRSPPRKHNTHDQKLQHKSCGHGTTTQTKP